MKWPKELRLIRHAESAYNILKQEKASDPEYQKFRMHFERDPLDKRTKALAILMQEKYGLGCSDRETPTTKRGEHQAFTTGQNIPRSWAIPDIIFVSPYLRTVLTWDFIKKGYPELEKVHIEHDERVRELDHGLSLLYNDKRIFHALHPDQAALRQLLGPYDYRYPNGENGPDVRLRTHDFKGTLIREFSGKVVWVVTHHLTILFFLANLERWSEEKFKEMDIHHKPRNCSFTSFVCDPKQGKDGKLVLKGHNKIFYKEG